MRALRPFQSTVLMIIGKPSDAQSAFMRLSAYRHYACIVVAPLRARRITGQVMAATL
jgi:hypothetical protein